MDRINAKCPNCSWSPPEGAHWNCLQCGQDIDHFTNVGRCSSCGFTHENTYCQAENGGCGQSSSHIDWYGDFESGLSKIDIFKP
ncbi:MAG: hypothetical protein ACPGVV_10270 [Croceimicrobium sp.]|nr:hypothetical protein [Bacteroidota bacterium]